MNTRTLHHFLSLADHLHFGRASNAENISISALSRHIRQLEEEIGVQLFLRNNRSVTLTRKGQKFQHYARDAVTQWSVICNELADASDELQGEISLYCSVTASHSILFDLLNRFRPNYPGIEIKLHTGDPENAISRVIAGYEQIAIAAHPRALPREMVFIPITISPLLFIAPKEQRKPGFELSSDLCKQDWTEVPMILSEGGIARLRIDKWFQKQNIKPNIYAQVAGNEAIVSMVSLGLGVGVVPKIVLDNSLLADGIQILDIRPPLEPYNVGLFTLKRHLLNPMVNAFWTQAAAGRGLQV